MCSTPTSSSSRSRTPPSSSPWRTLARWRRTGATCERAIWRCWTAGWRTCGARPPRPTSSTCSAGPRCRRIRSCSPSWPAASGAPPETDGPLLPPSRAPVGPPRGGGAARHPPLLPAPPQAHAVPRHRLHPARAARDRAAAALEEAPPLRGAHAPPRRGGRRAGPAAAAAPPPTFDKAAVRRALREAEPSYGHADLSACVAAAVRALAESETGAGLSKRLIIASDLAASAWRLDAPPPMVQGKAGAERPEVTLLDAARGAALPNLAVSELIAEPDPSVGPRGYRVTAF